MSIKNVRRNLKLGMTYKRNVNTRSSTVAQDWLLNSYSLSVVIVASRSVLESVTYCRY